MTSTSINQGYSLNRNSSRVIQPPGGQSADIFGRRTADSVASILSGMSSVGPVEPISGSQSQLQSSNASVKDGQSDTASQSSSRASSIIDGMPSLTILQAESQQRVIRDNITKSTVFSDAISKPKNSPKRIIHTIRRNPITGEVYDYPSKQ